MPLTTYTTEEEVKAVMAPGGDYDLKRKPSLLPFIQSASRAVVRLIAKASRLRSEGHTEIEEVTEADGKVVAMWLSAHLYQQSDKGYTSRSTKDASGSFQGQTGKGLDSTLYGQTAKLMDPSGLLASVLGDTKTVIVGGFWAGSDRADDI